MYPFERFTEDAKKTLTLSQEEAERSHHSYIGTEHLLLGILRNQQGRGYAVLQALGVRIEEVRRAIQTVLGRNERIIIQQIIPTSRVKKVIELSFEEARRMGSDSVGTEHMLLALLIEGEGIAAKVLSDLGVTVTKVREEIERQVAGRPRTAAATYSAIDPQRFRDVLSSFPSGVVILTAFGDDGRPRGLTVSAFSSVSVEPPLVLVVINKMSNTLPAVQHTGGFTANILAAGREQLARRMATKLTDKFDNLAWRKPESPVAGPVLSDDIAAYAECVLRNAFAAGDHWILIGLVMHGDHQEGVTPMVFTRRKYL